MASGPSSFADADAAALLEEAILRTERRGDNDNDRRVEVLAWRARRCIKQAVRACERTGCREIDHGLVLAQYIEKLILRHMARHREYDCDIHAPLCRLVASFSTSIPRALSDEIEQSRLYIDR